MAWTSPTGHRYTDAPTELTLPGELLTRIDAPRSTTGAADVEHRGQCAEPVSRDDPIPVAMKVHLAQRRALHAHVLERIRSVRRARLAANKTGAAARTPPAPAEPINPAFVRAAITEAPPPRAATAACAM